MTIPALCLPTLLFSFLRFSFLLWILKFVSSPCVFLILRSSNPVSGVRMNHRSWVISHVFRFVNHLLMIESCYLWYGHCLFDLKTLLHSAFKVNSLVSFISTHTTKPAKVIYLVIIFYYRIVLYKYKTCSFKIMFDFVSDFDFLLLHVVKKKKINKNGITHCWIPSYGT